MKFCGAQTFFSALMVVYTEQKSIMQLFFTHISFCLYLFHSYRVTYLPHKLCRRVGITNDYEDIVLVIKEFVIQCQLVKIVHKLSLWYTCEEVFVYNPGQEKNMSRKTLSVLWHLTIWVCRWALSNSGLHSGTQTWRHQALALAISFSLLC